MIPKVIHINIDLYFNYYSDGQRAKFKFYGVMRTPVGANIAQQRGSTNRARQIMPRTGDFRENGIFTAFTL